MNPGISANVSFTIAATSASSGKFLHVERVAPPFTYYYYFPQETEEFDDVTIMHRAFLDPRNKKPIPLSQAKKSLKL